MIVVRPFFSYKIQNKTIAKPDQKLKKWLKVVKSLSNVLRDIELHNIFYISIFKPPKKINNKDNNYKFYQIFIKMAWLRQVLT